MSHRLARTSPSRRAVGAPFWIGCTITPFLFLWAFWPFDPGDSGLSIFLWVICSLVFAGIVGVFTQALSDLLRAHAEQRLSWLEVAFLALVGALALSYSFALFYFPSAELPLRYGLAGAFPLFIGHLYARSRVLFRFFRRGSRNV